MADGQLVSLTLYAHPFSSYCWKVQIPLDADGTRYDYRNVDPSDPGVIEELEAAVAARQVSGAASTTAR